MIAGRAARAVAPFQIGYEHVAALGGLRGRNRDVPPRINGFWRNTSFHNYADYAMGETFHARLARLRELGTAQCCAIMCAEAVWWRCHRRIIADYLLAAGDTVFHILAPAKIEPARMTEATRREPSGVLTYPGGGQGRAPALRFPSGSLFQDGFETRAAAA